MKGKNLVKEDYSKPQSPGFRDKVKGFVLGIGEKIKFGRPTASVTKIQITFINLKKAELLLHILVKNPNPVPIPLVDIDYVIESNARKLVSGLIPDAGMIHSHGEETIKIPLILIFKDIKSTYKEIHRGSIIPYAVKADFMVDVPILGRLIIPLEKSGEIPIPHKPDVEVVKIWFERFSFEETVAIVQVRLDNKNEFWIGLNAIEYEIWLCAARIGGAEIGKLTKKMDKVGSCQVEIPVSFRPKELGHAVWDGIKGKGTSYSIKGNVDVDTPFGAMKLPFVKEGGSTSLKRDKAK